MIPRPWKSRLSWLKGGNLKPYARNIDIWMCSLRRVSDHPCEPAAEDFRDAACYTNEPLRSRFLASRGILRSISGGLRRIFRTVALRASPRAAMESSTSARGAGRGVHFNISHSRDRLMIAVSRMGPVGVDIEHLRPIDAGWLTRSWFSRGERREWLRLPPASRLEAFFHGWARKEAFLKATGFGMAMPLDSFSVSLHPRRAELLAVARRPARRTSAD